MTVDDILRDETLGRSLVSKPHSLALGEYPIDIHGKNDSIYLESDLGETKEKIPNDWNGDGGLFQIPFEVFIPEKLDGLLAAEKNISVSRVVNGSTRLDQLQCLQDRQPELSQLYPLSRKSAENCVRSMCRQSFGDQRADFPSLILRMLPITLRHGKGSKQQYSAGTWTL